MAGFAAEGFLKFGHVGNHAVDAVAVEIGGVPAAARGDSFGEHLDDGVEILAGEMAIRKGAAYGVE